LKVLDFKNMIDTHKVYVNFKTKDNYKRFQDLLKVNSIVEFSDNLRQTISKKLEVLFAVNIDFNT